MRGKRLSSVLIAVIVIASLLVGCGHLNNRATSIPSISQSDVSSVRRSDEGNYAGIRKKRAVALGGSLADMWILAGGELSGTTQDAYVDYNISRKIQVVGNTDEIDTEKIVLIDPDIILYSEKIPYMREDAHALANIGFKIKSIDVNNFNEYKKTMKSLIKIAGADEKYNQKVKAQEKKINAILKESKRSSLVGRTYVLFKVKGQNIWTEDDEFFTCQILNDIGLENIAADDHTDTMSLNSLVSKNPAYIFVIADNNDKIACIEFDKEYKGQKLWNSLTAVKKKHYIELPEDMFELKPNAKWGDAYEYAYDLLSEAHK